MTLKVAVAGTGNFAKYLFEELSAYGHEVIVLTRSKKADIKLEQRQTDYSIPSLVSVLEDVDALVSTVADYTNLPLVTKIHLDMLEAVKQSKRCKTYIPSEWTLNVEEYPEQPVFLAENNKTMHDALSASEGIRWTIVQNAWFMEYLLPQSRRHLRDVGPLWPMDYENKVFTIYGPGNQPQVVTAARDVAKAVASLIASKEPWDEFTFVQGEQTTWNDLFAAVKERHPEWTSWKKTLAETVKQIVDKQSEMDVLQGYFEIESYAGAQAFPQEKVERQRRKYFADVHFRSVKELLDEAAAKPESIV